MADPSYGRTLDRLLADYLHSDAMRRRVADGADAADAAVKAELSPWHHTGLLEGSSHAEVREFDAGFGMRVSDLYYAVFVANRAGRRRLREPGFRRGRGMRRKRGHKLHAPFMVVSRPSVFGEAVSAFDRTALWGE